MDFHFKYDFRNAIYIKNECKHNANQQGENENNGNINYIPDIVKFVSLSARHLTNKHKTIPTFFPFYTLKDTDWVTQKRLHLFYNCKGMCIFSSSLVGFLFVSVEIQKSSMSKWSVKNCMQLRFECVVIA